MTLDFPKTLAGDPHVPIGDPRFGPIAPGERRAVIAATMGTMIEWFDYALYGAAASLVLNQLFFPQFSAAGGVLAAFATFAVGFVSRPIGGLVIGHFGDRHGRKPALVLTILLMAVSTVAMGLLPTYEQIGIAAPVLLVVLRLLQGFGAGAEYAGAVTFVVETVPVHRRAYYTAFLQAATIVGIMLATLCFLVVSTLSEAALLSWGWRLPFLGSALLFGVALHIRKRLDETPEYVAVMAQAAARRQERRIPVGALLRESPKQVLFGFLSITGHNANVYILSAFSLSYMTNTLGMSRTDALSAVVVAALVGVILTPLVGALADRMGHGVVYGAGALFTLALAFPIFWLMETRNVFLATLGLGLGFGFGFSGLASAQGAFLADLFPPHTRFSGIAMTRELNSILIAGPTPFIAAALVSAADGSPAYVAVYLMACCAVTLFAVLAIRAERPYARHD